MTKFLDEKGVIIYSQLPPDIDFVAQDGNGKFYGYHLKPTASDDIRFTVWCKDPNDPVKPLELGDTGYNLKWKQSLVEIPKNRGVPHCTDGGEVIPMRIKQQQQPTGNTCTATCLAMITGIPVLDVIEEFHHGYVKWKVQPTDYLTEKNVPFKILPSMDRPQMGKLYLGTVPSLNLEAILHHVLIDLRDNDCVVYDPNKGKKGKKYYVGWHTSKEGDMEVTLKGYVLDLEIGI
jgi:hypothetical protein